MAGIPGIAGPGAPYPQYSVVVSGGNPTTGLVGKVGNSLDKSLLEVDSFPSQVYFFVSAAAAQAFVNSHGGGIALGPLSPVLGAGQNALNTGTGAIQTSGDILKGITTWLGQPNIWIRGAEILVGVLVLYIGLKASVAPEGSNIGRRTVGQTARRIVRFTPAGRALPKKRRYTITDRTPISGEMGGTRTVRYQARKVPK